MIQSSRGPGNSFARYREKHVNEPCLQRGVSIPMDHVHDHLAEIVYHCCITRFPYGAVKQHKDLAKNTMLFCLHNWLSRSGLDLGELGVMGELERTFCIPTQQAEIIVCGGRCFTSL